MESFRLQNYQFGKIIIIVMKRLSQRAELRRRLRTARVGLELSQIETAQRAKLSESRYWRIENGYDTPTPEERETIAKVLRMPAADLFPEQVGA